MLYEFHRKQNAKKPGSVHATYLLTGTRRPTPSQVNGSHSQEDGEDTVMQSSPMLPSSSFPQPDNETAEEEAPLIRSIMLVKQEHLDQAKATFETISSIHIYSLEANGLSDVQVLTECNRKVAADYASEDPLEAWKQYGTIQNPNVKRRKRGTAPPPPPAPIAKTADVKVKPAPPTAKPEQKVDSKPSSAKPTPEPEQTKKSAAKPAPAKRQNSDIFKSFAKSKTKPKGESQSSAEASPAPAEPEDQPMGGFSEDEADDNALMEAEKASDAPAGKSKKDRAAELEAMMDQEDEEMEDAATPVAEPEEPENAIEKVSPPKEEEPKETVKVENGRRRGRRRVMKKVTAKDEEGYLGECNDARR